VDHSAYPPYGRVSLAGAIEYPATINAMTDAMCFLGPSLSTPVAYVNGVFEDPFAGWLRGPAIIRCYEYLNLAQHVDNFGPTPPPFAPRLIPAWGMWRMVGAGPDGDRGMDIKQNRVYDPTNGTVSDGDVVRCQRFPNSSINPDAP